MSITKNCQKGNGLSPGDSPVSPIQSQEEDRAQKTSAIFGLSVQGCFASYDRQSRSLRTSQGYLFPTEEGFSTGFCRTFPKAGMIANGRAYRLRMSERRILGRGYGSYAFPTPRANSQKSPCKHGEGGMDLQTFVQAWPTPDVRGYTNRGSLEMLDKKTSGKSELMGMAYRAGRKKIEKLFPTPLAPRPHDSENTGQLSPDWVEALMGYPLHWTNIDKGCAKLNRYPAAWLDGAWEDGIPRIASGVKNRGARLKGLGNAIVPQCAEAIMRMTAFDLWRSDERMKEKL